MIVTGENTIRANVARLQTAEGPSTPHASHRTVAGEREAAGGHASLVRVDLQCAVRRRKLASRVRADRRLEIHNAAR